MNDLFIKLELMVGNEKNLKKLNFFIFLKKLILKVIDFNADVPKSVFQVIDHLINL